MALKLVPKPTISQQAETIKRIRRKREDGVLQCRVCGSRTYITVVTGAKLKAGRVTGGTAEVKYHCLNCWQKGRESSMLPHLTTE